jgi:hypothetical protein
LNLIHRTRGPIGHGAQEGIRTPCRTKSMGLAGLTPGREYWVSSPSLDRHQG